MHLMKQIVINQHYIPRSYLKNFGFLVNAKKDKWSLYAMENGGEIERRTTENVCSVDYLYDLPFESGDQRQFLEHAYEKHADRHFKEVTSFITDDSLTEMSRLLREKLLKSCLSLYFRTPKFVDLDQLAVDEINSMSAGQRERAWKIKKTQLLEKSVSNFEALYNAKKDCGISVNKIASTTTWEFISGDNPVIIRSKTGEFEEVFSDHNMIHVPITPKYAISIMPRSEVSLRNTFYRTLYGNDSIMGVNYAIETRHVRYLLGTKSALELYLKESPIYKAPAPANHPKILTLREVQNAVQGLVLVLQKNNGIVTAEVKSYFNWCWDNVPGFKDDPNSQELKSQMIS
jgi:hypothetical protein